ncbi:protein of unknown function (plasmid) [Rhodovastum atsumiense]|nr:macro domain-containing protein [Rhodovastum atsumiense]CAH2606181.1 protein of unknown function [Rhodovastum atsumiense]
MYQFNFVDPHAAFLGALTRALEGRDGVSATAGLLQPTGWDALIAAGNSFGMMDGGVDLAIARMLPGVEGRVRAAIASEHGGFLPVGAAVAVPADGDLVTGRWLLYAPTMESPRDIRGSVNAYLAMHAAIGAARRIPLPAGTTIACTGLGTGVGRLPPEVAARQMALAIRHAEGAPPASWRDALGRLVDVECARWGLTRAAA